MSTCRRIIGPLAALCGVLALAACGPPPASRMVQTREPGSAAVQSALHNQRVVAIESKLALLQAQLERMEEDQRAQARQAVALSREVVAEIDALKRDLGLPAGGPIVALPEVPDEEPFVSPAGTLIVRADSAGPAAEPASGIGSFFRRIFIVAIAAAIVFFILLFFSRVQDEEEDDFDDDERGEREFEAPEVRTDEGTIRLGQEAHRQGAELRRDE